MDGKGDSLYRLVVWTALVLALIVLYFVGGRFWRRWRAGSPVPIPQEEASSPLPSGSVPPSSLPPIKLKRVEGRASVERRAPPAVHPVAPD